MAPTDRGFHASTSRAEFVMICALRVHRAAASLAAAAFFSLCIRRLLKLMEGSLPMGAP
jgi:hypothetical protein